MQGGKVLKSTGKWYTVELKDGTIVSSRIRGKIRLKGLRTTNPVAVGDNVLLKNTGTDAWVITKILPRENYIIRKSVNLSKESHILAANIDRAYLLVTLFAPETSMTFIDRFLVSAEAYRIPITLLFNKIDLYKKDELPIIEEWMECYRTVGYSCHSISALDKDSVDFLTQEIRNKQVMISGHSGTGKSTLINQLDSLLNIKTAAISLAHLQGLHTTTFAEMYQLKTGGYIIDTPGIRSFGVIDLEKEVMSHYFPEMRALLNQCRFNNCQHLKEPGCSVKKAVEEGTIFASRYQSYYELMIEDREKTYR